MSSGSYKTIFHVWSLRTFAEVYLGECISVFNFVAPSQQIYKMDLKGGL